MHSDGAGVEYVPKNLYVKNKTRPMIIAMVILVIFLLLGGVDKFLLILLIAVGALVGNAVNLLMTILICSHSILVTSG